MLELCSSREHYNYNCDGSHRIELERAIELEE